MTDTLTALLLQLSEGGRPALLWGRSAKPHFGPAFDRLLAAGVLVECPPMEEWSACADCDCGFGIRPIQRIDGRIVAACPIDAGSDTELEEDDLREFRIDPERLVGLIAEAQRLRGTGRVPGARMSGASGGSPRGGSSPPLSPPGCWTSRGSSCF